MIELMPHQEEAVKNLDNGKSSGVASAAVSL